MDLFYLWAKFFKKIQGRSIVGSHIHRTSVVEAASHIVNCNFDRHSFCGYRCELINCDVGSFCSIANDVKIGGGMHPIDWVSTSPVFYEGRDSVKAKFARHKRPIPKRSVIGHDVWIGQGVFIKQGVKIGNGSVIGMGSVVTKDVEPYSIVAGNPARLIRRRFSDNVISQLQEIKWWEMDEEVLFRYAEFFTNPERFILNVKE